MSLKRKHIIDTLHLYWLHKGLKNSEANFLVFISSEKLTKKVICPKAKAKTLDFFVYFSEDMRTGQFASEFFQPLLQYVESRLFKDSYRYGLHTDL